jgi:uncharacterized membrane protein YhaH (DUF805 family)
MRAYLDALLRYFEFSGRSSRAQFWLFQLCNVILTLGGVGLDYATAHRLPSHDHPEFFVTFMVIFHLVPNITVTVRRLHDIGRSGWWYCLYFVPLGGFVLLFWMCRAGDLGTNEYGDPDGASAPASRRAFEVPIDRALRIASHAPSAAVFDPQTASTQRFI